MSLNLPPPTYEEQRTQLLISPPPGAVQFQKGFLGAHGERAAIEGELQIKGAEPGQWDKVQVLFCTLSTIFSYYLSSIEIFSWEVTLFSRTSSSTSSVGSDTIPSTLPFAIPLTPDTPQCIHTPRSSITHRLVARLSPINLANQALTETIIVHTRRYTTITRPLLYNRPYLVEHDTPVVLRVEVSRTTFRIGDPIAVYITVPPPNMSVIRDQGLRLRSVMAELIRVISVNQDQTEMFDSLPEGTGASSTRSIIGNNVNSDNKQATQDIPVLDASHAVITRSGSSCRFHSSRSVQIRLLLYPHETASRDNADNLSSNPEHLVDENSDCASITQSTLFHDVSFRIVVNVTFMVTASHSESVSSISIPIVLLPNIAPLPEVDESFASAYRKKHDKPPVRTVRHEDADIYENEAGPSALPPSGAPPPFEERDAPPPFISDPTSSTSSRLPTFLESESDLNGHIAVFPSSVDAPSDLPLHQMSIPGEGMEFGFKPEDQYDGLSSSFDRSATPPPSMDNANLDPDVTEFASLASQPSLALEALGLALEQSDSRMGGIQPSEHDEEAPPPPPLLDDPSDPPPSIDVEEFRRPPLRDQSSSPSQNLPATSRPDMSIPNNAAGLSNPNAPPPYLQPPATSEPEGIVTRPPPYVDVMPTGASRH
ncbi:hypothetical protein BU17DRAFT_38747 [Hysterangium stoloniferum]|nr:hypothetical protein BU17DRAFT_38747 [Hysterangium stoloniferum]